MFCIFSPISQKSMLLSASRNGLHCKALGISPMTFKLYRALSMFGLHVEVDLLLSAQ